MENPFIFGKVVRGEHFCDRESEIAQVNKIVKSRQHLVIISPRRYGKTSLIINALETSKISYIYIDCTLIEEEKDLVSLIMNEYVKKLDNAAIVEKFLKAFDISFSISINPLSVSIHHVKENSLKSILTKVSKHYVVVFDEFQDIFEKQPLLVNKIRSIVQFLENSVVMLGSKRHLLTSLFLKPRGIFYNFGSALHLQKINQQEFKQFIFRWFRKSGLKLSETEVDEVLNVTECHPFFTQYLCHFLFDKRLISLDSVELVLNEILNDNAVFYEETYRVLSSSQKKALVLLSQETKSIYSVELLQKFNLKSSQALQKALNSLVKKEIIDKNGAYYFTDLFFKRWLAKRT